MKYLSPLLIGWFVWTALPSGRAAEPEKPPAAELLDQAIWWPGDFGQICQGDGPDWSFDTPPIPAYGTVAVQEYFLSEARIGELNKDRAAIAGELVKRLKVFDWKHFPSAPKPTPQIDALSKTSLAKLPPDGPSPRPWKAENSHALGATMLRIIEATDAVETLPELLRLEGELNALNEAAIEARWRARGSWNELFFPTIPVLSIPPIEVGECGGWEGSEKQFKDPKTQALFGPGKRGEAILRAWEQWENQLFDNIIFQREMLGVSLGLLEKNGYASLRHSLIGRLTALVRRREGLALMEESGIRSEAGLPAELKKQGLIWDSDLAVPRYNRAVTSIPWSKEVREEACRLVRGFIKSEPVASITDGAALLEECIASPGSWDQMCAMPPPIPSDVPMPGGTTLASRSFNLGDETMKKLQAFRDLVVPVLSERMRGMILEAKHVKGEGEEENLLFQRSAQNSRNFGPLVLQVVECLNSVECLPDLLRLEQRLSDIIARAEVDPAAPLPDLVIDSPAAWDFDVMRGELPPDTLKKRQRANALFVCKIYQRELLSLIKTLLEREGYSPIKASVFVKAQLAAGRKRLLEEVTTIKSEDDIPHYLTKLITWDNEAKKAHAKDGAVMPVHAVRPVQLPYSNAIRDEIRSIANRFLQEVPPEKRKAGDGMVLSWLENQ